MNTFDYSLLIKDITRHNKILKLQRAKKLAFFACCGGFAIAFLAAILSMAMRTSTLVPLVIILVTLFLYFGFLVVFQIILFVARKNQTLDPESDSAFVELNKKYGDLTRRYIITMAICSAIFVLSLTTIFVFILLDIQFSLDWIVSIALSVMLVVSLLAGTLIGVFMRLRFASEVIPLVTTIREYFYEAKGLTPEQIAKQQKLRIFTSHYDAQKATEYLFPDKALRKKMNMSFVLLIVFTLVLFFALNISTMFFLGLLAAAEAHSAILLSFAVLSTILFFAPFAAMAVLLNLTIGKLRKQQRQIFDADSEKYKYHIELAELNREQQKKSAVLLVATSLPILTISIIIGTIFYLTNFFAPSSFSIFAIPMSVWIGLFVWMPIGLPISIIMQLNFRKQSAPIERKIDEHLNTISQQRETDTSLLK